VVEAVRRRGHSVLNADDPLTLNMRRHSTGQLALFSMHGGADMSAAVRAHIDGGGKAAVFEASESGGDLVLHQGQERSVLMAARDIPAALGGAAGFNIQNALAAALMTWAQGVPMAAVRRGLAGFASSFEQNPGRLNVFDGHDFRVILDYAHNPASLSALADMLTQMRGQYGRTIGMVSIPGDRRNEDILTMGRIAARVFDTLVFREAPDGRGRPSGEVNTLLTDGALNAGASSKDIHRIIDERAAAAACLSMAQPGDLVVLLPTDVGGVWDQVRDFQPNRDMRATPGLEVVHV
jgi:cyanophycin synthetase